MADTEARWYVAHTYSGYENKVKADIENTIVNRNLQDQILEVYVPMQEVEREGKDSKKLVQQKMFPAYVLIKMLHGMLSEILAVLQDSLVRDQSRFHLRMRKWQAWDL